MASNKTGGAKKRPSSESKNQNEMKTTEIRDLIDFISQSGLNEVNIETKELKLHVKREPDQKVLKATAAPVMAMPAPAPMMHSHAPAPAAAPAPKAEKAPSSSAKTVEIKSPMIGTFYRSSNP